MNHATFYSSESKSPRSSSAVKFETTHIRAIIPVHSDSRNLTILAALDELRESLDSFERPRAARETRCTLEEARGTISFFQSLMAAATVMLDCEARSGSFILFKLSSQSLRNLQGAKTDEEESAERAVSGDVPEKMGRSLLDGSFGILGPGGNVVGSPAVKGYEAVEISAEVREQRDADSQHGNEFGSSRDPGKRLLVPVVRPGHARDLGEARGELGIIVREASLGGGERRG